jgi:hypothetical protein
MDPLKTSLSQVNPAGEQEETEMPGNLKYRIVLSAKHPNVDPSVITSKLGLEPGMGWASGTERRTTAGALLPGVSKTSAWGYSFDVDGSRFFLRRRIKDAIGPFTKRRVCQ